MGRSKQYLCIMKTKTLTIVACALSTLAFAQSNVIQNGGFENWTSENISENLDIWLTTENEVAGTGAVIKSSDAVDGASSLLLTTIDLQGDTTFGFALLGGFGEDGPGAHVAYNSPVDSITGWYKYQTMGNDSATILVSQKSALIGIPEMQVWKFAGTQNTWKRFAYPLSSSTQDSILIAFISSDAFADYSVPGSFLMVDDIQFTSSLGTPAAAIPNNSFENWTPINVELPNSWFSYNQLFQGVNESPVTKTNDAASGSFAASLETISIDGNMIPGVLSVGPIPENSSIRAIPYTAQPTTFALDYKYSPSGLDTAFYALIFYNDNTIISAEYNLFAPNPGAYINYSIPISVPVAPDSVLLYFVSGENSGSTLLIDNVALTGGNVGLNSWTIANQMKVFPNPSTGLTAVLINSSTPEKAEYSIVDMTGRVLLNRRIQVNLGTTKIALDLTHFEAGNYLFVLQSSSGTKTEQILISK